MKVLVSRIATATIVLFVSFPSRGFAADPGKQSPAGNLFPPERMEKILESPQREQWQKPGQVIAALGLKKGAVVADFGAGSGYFSFRMADVVGPSGKVYAVDIQDEMLDYIRQKISRLGINNIIPVKSTETEPRLPIESCDCILLVDTYHELSAPVTLMKNLRKTLKPGGTIAIISRKKLDKRSSVPSDVIIEDMRLAGFAVSKTHDFLERQFFLVFTPF